jgi:1-acyl-sn-glycerol-3-phosphate acyltransferase
VRTGAPVVPVHLHGTRRILKKGGKGVRPAHTEVTFGRPLRADEGESPAALAERIERAIAVLADERSEGFWDSRRNAAAGATPTLTGPESTGWRRAWALDENRRHRGTSKPWPPRSAARD